MKNKVHMKSTRTKREEKKKELKIMSPRMLPNLSNLSTTAVWARNLLFNEGKQTKVIKQY